MSSNWIMVGRYQLEMALGHSLLKSPTVHAGEWQSIRSDNPVLVTHEMLNTTVDFPIPDSQGELTHRVGPDMPWAEDHFQERVSGKPLNPPPSHVDWPHGNGKTEESFEVGNKFSHTYPERFWPKRAGRYQGTTGGKGTPGIRYAYGDLADVVEMLYKSPLTRQAWLPVWFPEDTGAVEGQRVPCTIGYQFIVRENRLHVVYMIRSVDFVRHMWNDIYMACRLGQWVLEKCKEREEYEDVGDVPIWSNVHIGNLTMHMTSLHLFSPHVPRIRRLVNEGAPSAA